jgi:D-cysteine desulfhydrase
MGIENFAVVTPGDRRQFVWMQSAEPAGLYCADDHVRDIVLMDHGTGAELRWVPRMEMVPLGVAATRVRHVHDKPYVVAPGGSDPVGTLGYVSAGLELAGQIGRVARPSAIHVAAGTLGTAAGLALGLALAGQRIPIRATRITSRIVTHERALRGLVQGTAALLNAAGVRTPDGEDVVSMIDLRHGHIGRGYGRETDAGRRATRIFAAAGLTLDPTYTAKAAADLLDSPETDGPPLFLLTLSRSEPRDLLARADPATLPPAFRRYLNVHKPLP